jgi:hypothetical protein
MHKQWQWMDPIKHPAAAQRRPPAPAGSRSAALDVTTQVRGEPKDSLG